MPDNADIANLSKNEKSLGEAIDEAKKSLGKTPDAGKAECHVDKLKEIACSAPIVKLLNTVLSSAVKEKASDVHFEPFEKDYRIRYRIDGICYDAAHPPRDLISAINSGIKALSNLDVAENILPQNGSIIMDIEGKAVEIRVSTIPTLYGESIAVRILDKSAASLSLDQIGMDDDIKSKIREIIKKPSGIFLTAGPAGSGKATTLYSCLAEINKIDCKIITVEDPVEHDIEGIIQTAVNARIGLTFARTLKHILMQDPDVIMVGEIRDAETAGITVQSAIAGRLVFSALHANDSLGAIVKLVNLDIEPFLIASTVKAVLAQRLVRKICTKCRKEYEPLEHEILEFGVLKNKMRDIKFYKGEGCSACNGSGYKGRTGLYELFVTNDAIRDLITTHENLSAIQSAAHDIGMESLRENGFKKIIAGVTTIEEVLRETKEIL